MAKLDDLLLFEEGRLHCSGGAYLLNGSPLSKKTIQVQDGWTVFLSPACKYAVCQGPPDNSYTASNTNAFNAIQRGLDILAVGGFENLRTSRADEEHLVWWADESQQFLCCHFVSSYE